MVAIETKNVGRITQIIGPVLDVEFAPGQMPNIYNALVVRGKNQAGQDISVTCEVQQLLGDHCVRAVSMSATDGLMRGMEVADTGNPLTVPVGQETLGRIFNVLGEPVDNCATRSFRRNVLLNQYFLLCCSNPQRNFQQKLLLQQWSKD
eukprot:TRINITY_DN645_c1_g2_i2.p2 TRINITY_DN645_c1_g2~~TRINITY_DN645_c1_g2_i2.p2  ORF type:complete len:149 (+),score=8.37 TRINITY_DN645_c1_g2_i2:233-679(+)